MENAEPIPAFVWDTCEIAKHYAQALVESGECDNEDVAFSRVNADSELFRDEWDSLTEALSEKLNEWNPEGRWYAEVKNFGWRRQSGYTSFTASTGATFLQKLLPKTECTFRIYCDSNQMRIQNFHHDSPVGNEWYTVRPAKESDDEI